ncbi:Gfo/Idh/MocA family protein [Planctomycetes bacterium K23_9]|uniref:Inositol 2-dehydrogenase n=1 Tax=Stieleria marina TaxID=1930275 RepID=A0A517NNP8_9BACT|nr:Inositol 2-dehydrogenase [Planctomycetes bacterium K23_9]
MKSSRRRLLAGAAVAVGGGAAFAFRRYRNHALITRGFRPTRVGVIGVGAAPGGRGVGMCFYVTPHAKVVALADVDKTHLQNAVDQIYDNPDTYTDYRELLNRDDIDVVIIATPTHWKVKIAIDAMNAGKDVYCEKPITLTVAEGEELKSAVRSTGRMFQAGTQQRTDARFVKACRLIRDGQLGKIRRIVVELPSVTWTEPGPFAIKPVPESLDWKTWLGSAPTVGYQEERCHYNWRYWFDYAGGKLCGWGAHHIDIARWALPDGENHPSRVDGQGRFSGVQGGYDTPITFELNYALPNDVTMVVRGGKPKLGKQPGILFEGEESEFYISRSEARGKLAEKLVAQSDPQVSAHHFLNLIESIETGAKPHSDVDSQVDSMNTCHIGNICLRLGRPLQWDADERRFIDDEEANAMLTRKSASESDISPVSQISPVSDELSAASEATS